MTSPSDGLRSTPPGGSPVSLRTIEDAISHAAARNDDVRLKVGEVRTLLDAVWALGGCAQCASLPYLVKREVRVVLARIRFDQPEVCDG